MVESQVFLYQKALFGLRKKLASSRFYFLTTFSMEPTTTITGLRLDRLADALVRSETPKDNVPAAGTRDINSRLRETLDALNPEQRASLRTLLAERGLNGNAAARLLAQQQLRVPELPFADTPAFRALAESFTPRNGIAPERPQYPQGVAPHLDSHHDQLTQLMKEGAIPRNFEAVLRTFIELHDRGYAGETNSLNAEEYSANAAEYRSTYEDLGANAEQSERMAAYVLGGLRESNTVKQHLVGRVIGHGVNSVRFARKALTERGGMNDEQALALAKLYATHHMGYPLTPLVDGFASILQSPIPADLRKTFFIGGEDVPTRDDAGNPMNPADREALTQDRADALRAATADETAPVLGISTADARAIAAISYALDRTTPARRMRSFELKEDGTTAWTGGETEKRYPLIIGNIDGAIKNPAVAQKPEKNLRSVYDMSLTQFAKERDAAVRTARNLGVHGLEEIIMRHAAREIGATADIQQRCLQVAKRLGVGDFATIAQDIARVTEEYRRAENNPASEDDDREALGYLLGTLRGIEPRVKQLFPNG